MAKSHIHKQPIAADVWTVVHNFGTLPVLDVAIDEGGDVKKVLGDSIVILDVNTLEVRFTNPQSGTARLMTGGREPRQIFDIATPSEPGVNPGIGSMPSYDVPQNGQFALETTTFDGGTIPQTSPVLQ